MQLQEPYKDHGWVYRQAHYGGEVVSSTLGPGSTSIEGAVPVNGNTLGQTPAGGSTSEWSLVPANGTFPRRIGIFILGLMALEMDADTSKT